MNNVRKTYVKVCGFTRPDQARAASLAGVDAIGLVFYGPSPRNVSLEQAIEIAEAVGPFTSLVGLFVNAPEEAVRDVLAKLPLDILQFHGDESPDYCESFGRRYMKAIRMREGLDLDGEIARFGSAAGILLDAYQPGVPGGTGERFDWQRVPKSAAKPIILAGGLTPDNIADAVKQTAVYAVDVSGGVEKAHGDKCLDKIRRFLAEVDAT
ncbi:phosphoribosylanthranilate isomerase [Pseudoteredinibacter isoporae]|uniref:N-(5'-phosphoribosyl)anthranilate isomerase n=1 Tax=Pseudoteredinibacter isoporae TaxID=570281 RepID=A0A7X0JW63_9GAMM|nr:phosphoribosylanthranilate isomerase [Pseudoteredinibacter isoporae]MBB6523359.1 phosphoribosylanthranilate isomerase [Pseudoteredinibacter isoporae]NHO88872.1 phosphoribosylanthranilate isomerase [Pseudoteredinibacter isoporae]NIB24420.1 phosphoribosylanthranilate isomerase [Pseudoteredinibacter isoporae]